MYVLELPGLLLFLFYLLDPSGSQCLRCLCGNVKNFSPNQVWLGAYVGNDVHEVPELIGIFQLCAGAVTAAL